MQIKYKFVTAIKKAAERAAFLVIFTETASYVSERNTDIARRNNEMIVSINKLCLACDVLEFVRGYLVADLCQQFCRSVPLAMKGYSLPSNAETESESTQVVSASEEAPPQEHVTQERKLLPTMPVLAWI